LKNLSYRKLSIFLGILLCINLSLFAQDSEDEEESEEEKISNVVNDTQLINKMTVYELLDYNFYSPELQAFFNRTGDERKVYGQNSFLKIIPVPGIEMKFNQSRVFNQLKYNDEYEDELPYGLTRNMKFREAKKVLGKTKVSGNRRTIILMDNWLEVAVYYPKKGRRKSIEKITFYSMRPAKPCERCEEMHKMEEDAFWRSFTDSLNVVRETRKEKDRIEAENKAKEQREKAEKEEKARIERERIEKERIAEYERKEKERKKAMELNNPICSDLGDILDAGPGFDVYVGEMISEDIDANLHINKYRATKLIPGFTDAVITNQLMVAFLISISTYEGSVNFSSRSKAQEFYYRILDQIKQCDEYVEETKIQKSSSILMQNSFRMSSGERYGQIANVVLTLEAISSSNSKVTIRIVDE